MKQFLVCKDCGSNRLQFCGWSRWDYDKQEFVYDGLDVKDPFKSMENQYADCEECGAHDDGQAVWMETDYE